MANELILQLDRAQEHRALSTAEAHLRRGLKGRVLGLASLDRTIARQRARTLGVREGQADAQFFRPYTPARRRRNFIPALRHADQVASSQEEKEELATRFYADLLGQAQPRLHDLDLSAIGVPPSDLAGLSASSPSRRCGRLSKGCHPTVPPVLTASPRISTRVVGRLSSSMSWLP